MSSNCNDNRPLWAPWRIDYILSNKTKECFLCNKKIKSSDENEFMVIKRGKYSFVTLNAYPYNAGHLMVCPYDHVGNISNITKETLNEMMELCIESKEALDRVMHPQGFNIGFNLGIAAGAGLEEHIHLHIVPRWNGDTNFMPVLGNTRVVPQALRDSAEMIRKSFDK